MIEAVTETLAGVMVSAIASGSTPVSRLARFVRNVCCAV